MTPPPDPSQKDGPSRIPWPPILYGAALCLAILAGALQPAPWFGPPFADILFAVGLVVFLAGVVLVVRAVLALRTARTAIAAHRPATTLVAEGVFSITRNPIYLGLTLLLISIALIRGQPWFMLFALLAAFATTKLAIEPEERHLEVRFGKRWRDYAKRVRRWV